MITPHGLAAVTGGSGFLGRVLVRRLAGEQPVRVLARRRDDWTAWCEREGIEVVTGDLADRAALSRLVRGATTVFHCAAYMGKRDAARSAATNEEGTAQVAAAAAQAGVARFLYVSSISVFGATPCPGGTISERVTPVHPERLNHYARTKYLGEGRLRAAAGDEGMPFTIVRPTNVYGPDAGPWFHQYARLVARVPVAFGRVPVDVVYVDDVVEAMLLAVRSPAGANQVFHIGHEMVPLQEFVARVAAVTGRRLVRLPRAVDRAVCAVVDGSWRTLTGTRMSLSLLRPVRYPHLHAWLRLGYEPRVTLAEGFRRIDEWYRGQVPARVPSHAERAGTLAGEVA